LKGVVVNVKRKRFVKGRRSFDGIDMGTGKSLTSIAVAGALYQAGKIRRVLVVAPLSILGVWDEEFAKFADFDYSLAVLEGSAAKKIDTLRHMRGSPLQVAVINYESAWRLEKELAAWNPDMIIADEGHKIKTHNIAASKAMHRLGARARYRLLLTGTVITNKAIDVFSQYKFLSPGNIRPELLCVPQPGTLTWSATVSTRRC
jgi:SNF2 family DNA or RNA helicase